MFRFDHKYTVVCIDNVYTDVFHISGTSISSTSQFYFNDGIRKEIKTIDININKIFDNVIDNL